MLSQLAGLVGILVIMTIFGRAFLGTLGGSGGRRRGGGGGGAAWGIFFADLVVRFGTAAAIATARIFGALTMSAVRFGKGRMERSAGRMSKKRSVRLSRPPEQQRERPQRPGQGEWTDPDELNPWGDDD